MNTALIQEKMAELGLSIETFAERCLVASKYMEQVVRRGLRPSKRLIAMMARELGVTPEELFPDTSRQAV